MPIDPAVALGAELPEFEFSWTSSDVLLYHLAIGAGVPCTDPQELRYAYEKDLHVLSSFAVVAPTLGETEAPRVSYPGIEIDLRKVLHGSQEIVAHRPIPTDGQARAITRVTDVWDKGSAAIVVTETEVRDVAGGPLWTNRSSIFARGEGGFGGERGPSATKALPQRQPDLVNETKTLPQQALWYRLLGDRNPLHVDPGFAAKAGFPAPILHGLASYAIVCKALVDEALGGDTTRLRSFAVRFAGVVYPGETLRTLAWREADRWVASTVVAERQDAPALSDVELVFQ
ncbi:MAG: MaoC family dehydratase N-terminal domain-containing protein [Actinomycetota bacterium]|nr:MaoC family dehydratase N-terminal domain-containing protein [Actinomycetota bacterium]